MTKTTMVPQSGFKDDALGTTYQAASSGLRKLLHNVIKASTFDTSLGYGKVILTRIRKVREKTHLMTLQTGESVQNLALTGKSIVKLTVWLWSIINYYSSKSYPLAF
jgi:hypothetical protein